MPAITLPPTVANGTILDPSAQWNTMRTALSKLPRGLMTLTDLQTSTAPLATLIGTTEVTTNLITTAIATEAGRRYRICFVFQLRNGQALTSYATANVRRTASHTGTVIRGPIEISDKSGTASRDIIVIEAIDQPGAQAAQQWNLSMKTDASTVDVYGPAHITVEDIGAAS